MYQKGDYWLYIAIFGFVTAAFWFGWMLGRGL